MVTGWAQIGWKWYYFNEDGAAVKDDVVIDGKTYILEMIIHGFPNCTRKEFVERAKRYLGCNEKDGSFKKIIDSYNKLDPLPRGYKVKYTDSWCMTFVSAIVRECNLLDIIPVECSCGKAVEKGTIYGHLAKKMMLMFLKLVILLCMIGMIMEMVIIQDGLIM